MVVMAGKLSEYAILLPPEWDLHFQYVSIHPGLLYPRVHKGQVGGILQIQK